MTNREIFFSAMRFIGEPPSAIENADYEDRAPYLIAAFCSEAAQTASAYCEANGITVDTEVDLVFLDLDLPFPYADRFAMAAALYLAAMLVIDENIELSDKLFDRYCYAMATIQSEIPSQIEKIAQKYGAL